MPGYSILRLPGESLASVWGRRLVSVPLYAALFALVAAALPLVLGATLAADLIARRAPLARTRAVLFFALFLFCEMWGALAAGLLWAAAAGGRLGGPARYLAWNAALQRAWSGMIFGGAVRIFDMRVRLEGVEAAARGPYLFFVRHASTADTILAAALVANRYRILLRYVMKRELLWDPCLDIVGRRLPNAFVDRSGTRSEAEVRAVAGLADGLGAGDAVLLFPEGTRFAPRRRDAAVAKLRERGKSDLAAVAAGYRNVLPPRLGGALALLERAPAADVVFMAHTGFEGARSFAEFWRGDLVGCELRVRIRRIPASEVPAAGRDVWLFREWAREDEWISGNGVTA